MHARAILYLAHGGGNRSLCDGVRRLRRDKTFDEDACLARTGLGPANRATCNNIALALILHQGNTNAAAALRHFTLYRKAAFAALLSPG